MTPEVKVSADLVLAVLKVVHQANALLSLAPPKKTTYQLVNVGGNSVDMWVN